MADGCATLAEAAILDRVYRAFGEVMRRRALVDHRGEPCWPEAYLKRRAQAEEARLGLSGATDPAEAGIGPGGLPDGLSGGVGRGGALDDEADLSKLAALADDDEVEDDATGEGGSDAGGSDERGVDGGGGDRGDDAGGEAELNRDSR